MAMKNTQRSKLLSPIFLVSLICAVARPVFAVPIVSVDADSMTPGIQASATVDLATATSHEIDVVITDVEALAPLNAFELDLDFDPSILDATGVSSGGFLLAPTFVVQSVVGASTVEFAEVTLLPFGAVGDGVLATITFDLAGIGISALDLNNVILSAPFGIPIVPASVDDGSLTVIDSSISPAPMPEPSTSALFAMGIFGLKYLRRRRIV